ncbi:MAG: hypothetical protein K1000chlam3_00204 [Chlamydiae bacterium]|nr:hypothetical protein [Chlamydiota bacterium]
MSTPVNAPPVLHSFSEYNKILGQNINQHDPEGNPITVSFLSALFNNADNAAKSLFGRVKETHTQSYQKQDKEQLTKLLNGYQNELTSLQVLITLANVTAEQFSEMKLNKNSPPPIGASRIVCEGDIPEQITKIKEKAAELQNTYCTESSSLNPNWSLADYMHALEKVVKE